MTHPILRHGLAIAGALLTYAVAIPADAGKQVTLPTIQVVGVDAVCDSFTVTSDSAGVTVLTCVPVGTSVPGAPTGCVATVNGSSSLTLPNAGGSANLSVSCATPTSGLTYNWFRNGNSGASALKNWTDALGANTGGSNVTTSYQVQVCASGACVTAPTSPLTVVVPGSSSGGGGPTGWSGRCDGFASTRVIELNWAAPNRQLTANYGGFGTNDALVVQFTTGNVSTTNNLPNITAVEYGSSPSSRTAVLSATPCDFSQQATPGAMSVGNSVTAVFAIGTGSGFGFYPVLTTNTTYYLNIKNSANATCASNGVCEMSVDLIKRGGL
jgi:hypothetical protein